MKKSWIVVPFTVAKGKLTPGTPRPHKQESTARIAAERMSKVDGVIVLEQEGDADAEPRLVYQRGSVPAELIEQLAA